MTSVVISDTSIDIVTIGMQGPTGPAGSGMPSGGTTGQVLKKASNTNYDIEWDDESSGSGSVTTVSVASANGFSGSVANATSTPAITMGTSVTGLLKGNGTAISAATSGTDYVAPNSAITGATKTKVTYDVKGLVTAGADATTVDIADSTNKRYVTDANLVVIGNTSGTNTGDQTTITGNAGTATTLATGRTISISGDLSYTSPSFNGSANVTAAGTLATVNSNVGSFTNASVTVNAKGLVTAASSGTAVTPGGSTTQIQYNNSGAFAGSSGLTFSGGVLSDINSTTSTSVSTYQAIAKSIYAETNWDNTSDTTAVGFSVVGYAKHSSATSITGVGHIGGVLGYATKTSATGTDTFITGLEGRVGATLGTVTTAAAVTAAFDDDTINGGNITIGVGFYCTQPATSTKIAVPFSFYNSWAAAPVRSLAQVQCPSLSDETGANVKLVPALVTGPSSATDNAVIRFDTTTGKVTQNSAVIIDDNGELYAYTPKKNVQTGTTYTLSSSDSGKVVELSNASAITLTLPNSLSNFCCTIVQKGAGQVTFSAASGATIRNSASQTKTSGQYAVCTLYVTANSGGSAAEYVLAGATGA